MHASHQRTEPNIGMSAPHHRHFMVSRILPEGMAGCSRGSGREGANGELRLHSKRDAATTT
jgi:hypothetical protein